MTNDSTNTPETAKLPPIDPYKIGELIAEHILTHEDGDLNALGHMTVGAALVLAWIRPGGVEIEATADIARRVGEGAKDSIIRSFSSRSKGDAA